MSHLSPERLAALVDEEPLATEFAHLMACARCAAEREAHRALVAMAGLERASIGLPLTRWESISSVLRSEEMVAPPPLKVAVVHQSHRGRVWLQAAAALLFVAGGVAMGRYSAGVTPVPGIGAPVAAATTVDSTAFRSVDDARVALSQAEARYQGASAYLAQNDSASRGSETLSATRTRLAALDRLDRTIREAMNDAPYDPVINGYYLATLGQREATLRQLNTALPVGLRINSY